MAGSCSWTSTELFPSSATLFEWFSLETTANDRNSWCTEVQKDRFYHAAVTEPLTRDLIVVEVSSPTAKEVPVQSHNTVLDQRSRKVIV